MCTYEYVFVWTIGVAARPVYMDQTLKVGGPNEGCNVWSFEVAVQKWAPQELLWNESDILGRS